MAENKLRLATCQHFTGVQHVRCKMEIAYANVRGTSPYSLACIHSEHWVRGGKPHCTSYLAMTEEMVVAEDAEFQRIADTIAHGMSPCCKAPLDLRGVSAKGRYAGHGPRFCSQCGKLVFTACGR